jgi:hypothetical protein
MQNRDMSHTQERMRGDNGLVNAGEYELIYSTKNFWFGKFFFKPGLIMYKSTNYDRRFWKAEDKELEFHAYPVYFLVLSMSFNDSKFVDWLCRMYNSGS